MYIFNLITTTYASVPLGSPYAKYIIYSQFIISFIYFTYGFTYIVFPHKDVRNIVVLVALGGIGLALVALSYVEGVPILYSFGVAGSASLAMCIVGIGLHYIKIRNK
jgi:hypothetical protein